MMTLAATALEANIQLWQGLLAIGIPTIGGIATAAITYQSIKDRLSALEKETKGIDKIQTDLAEIKTDVRWLRDERKQSHG